MTALRTQDHPADLSHLFNDTSEKEASMTETTVPTAEGQTVERTQGQVGMFHVLSQIGDGVFVAWDRCHNAKERHSIADCNCKGGPTEPHYVTQWREEFIAKRDKPARRLRPKMDADGKVKHVEVDPDTPPLSDENGQASETADTVDAALTSAIQATTEASEEDTK